MTALPDDHPSSQLDTQAAAAEVGLTPAAVEALAGAGFLASTPGPDGRPRFSLSDLKAFEARNADNGAGADVLAQAFAPRDFEPSELVALLDDRCEEMARRMVKMFETVFPWVADWSPSEREQFVQDTKDRFQAILAVAAFGSAADETLMRDLYSIGASAARTRTELPQLLVALRISRDLVVQNAVDLAESDGRHGGLALSLLLTRILPTMDKLADALAAGYWETISGR